MDLLCGYRRRHLTKDYSLAERNLGSSLGQEAIRRPPPCPACSSGAPCRSRRRRSRQPRRARPLGGRSEPPKQKKTPNSSLNTISLPARLSRPINIHNILMVITSSSQWVNHGSSTDIWIGIWAGSEKLISILRKLRFVFRWSKTSGPARLKSRK